MNFVRPGTRLRPLRIRFHHKTCNPLHKHTPTTQHTESEFYDGTHAGLDVMMHAFMDAVDGLLQLDGTFVEDPR